MIVSIPELPYDATAGWVMTGIFAGLVIIFVISIILYNTGHDGWDWSALSFGIAAALVLIIGMPFVWAVTAPGIHSGKVDVARTEALQNLGFSGVDLEPGTRSDPNDTFIGQKDGEWYTGELEALGDRTWKIINLKVIEG